MKNSDRLPDEPILEPFFNKSLDCLCITDHQGYFIKANPSFRKLLGYTLEELYSTKVIEFIHPEDRELTMGQREKLIKDGALVNFENRYHTKTGDLIWLNWTSFSLLEKGLIYSSARDITFKKKMEVDRNSTIERLSLLNERLQQQNYSTAHDLRSPLNNLMSLVGLIEMDSLADDDTKEILRLVKRSAEGLKLSFNTYLDALKVSDRDRESLEPVNLAAIFQKVQSSISTLIENSKTEFHVDFSEMETVKFKDQYLESIFLNLITNSIKYGRPGIPPVISILSHNRNGSKALVYSDNGSGFDLDQVGHRIFKLNERFHKNKDSKGIGLYLVHSQVTDLGGTIHVDSKINEGTTFTIKFN